MDEHTATTSTYKPTILLVDDEESILNSLRRLLRGQPYDVLLAGSGARPWISWLPSPST
jgi:response regulator RpfG family c-di-GMP phosphodiesterase